MIRFEIADGGMPALGAEAPVSADEMFELGMIYSSGREVPADLVTAHKWFNLAAMKGNAEAVRLRREIAAEMSDAEIGQAQRAARDWLKAHPEAAAPEAPACAPRPDACRSASVAALRRTAGAWRPRLVKATGRRAYRPRAERWPSG